MKEEVKETWIEKFGRKLSKSVESWMPDPLIFALLLSIITALMALLIIQPYTKLGPSDTLKWLFLDSWYKGFWELLTFAMQMVLILVTGYAVAYHPLVYRGLRRLATYPKNTKQAAALTAAVAMFFAWINWGLGLIVGALLARTIGIEFYKQGKPLHYPVVCAAGYAGLGLTWHWGLSASAPLLSNTKGHPFEKLFTSLFGEGLVTLDKTIFNPYTIGNLILIYISGILIFWALAPRDEKVMKGINVLAPHVLKAAEEEEKSATKKPEQWTIADRLENSKILAGIISIIFLISMYYWFSARGFFAGLDLNAVNYIFIMIGFLLYLNPIAYMRAIARAAGATAGIIIQFPFYAAIMGLMRYTVVDGSPNLATVIANSIAAYATPFTWPLINLLLSGFINIFIPSGGGQWAATGEILTRVSASLGVPVGKTIISYAAGDMWTNLFTPFWAIPLLGITGTRARDIFGYCIAAMLLATIPFAIGLTFIPYY
jgi:short-chain fatty acids transporter